VVWGLLHGIILITENSIEKIISIKIPVFVKIIYVFTGVCFTWIFFRVKEVKEAVIAIHHILSLSVTDHLPDIFNPKEFVFVLILLAGLVFSETFIQRRKLTNYPILISITSVLFLLSYLFGEFNFKQFIYFQF
jgi:alginate O-acetyltransferase complex protein AlgI